MLVSGPACFTKVAALERIFSPLLDVICIERSEIIQVLLDDAVALARPLL